VLTQYYLLSTKMCEHDCIFVTNHAKEFRNNNVKTLGLFFLSLSFFDQCTSILCNQCSGSIGARHLNQCSDGPSPRMTPLPWPGLDEPFHSVNESLNFGPNLALH
jgi:hypothetical protein